jgi:hypothetical protein
MKCIADQMDLADIKSIIQMTSVVYMFFPRAHRTFSSVDYTLGFKLSLTHLRNCDHIKYLSDHNDTNVEINKKFQTIHKEVSDPKHL